jgi:hypothetical protein
VGQDGILRAGCQPALVGLFTGDSGRVINPPQVANLPHSVRYSAPLLAVIANCACLTPLVAASKPAKR